MKSETDKFSGREYNNFKTDSTEVKFIQNRSDRWLMFREADVNSDVVYYLNKLSFCELLDIENQFYKLRVHDRESGYVEGWSKKSGFVKDLYYGTRLSKKEKAKEVRKQAPIWIVKEATLFKDSLLTTPIATLTTGDSFYSNDRGENYFKVDATDGLGSGFVKIVDTSPFMILKDGSQDFSKISNFSFSLLENDVDINSFVSYKVLEIKNGVKNSYLEDKRCFAKNDTLYYRYSHDNNNKSIFKDFKVKGKELNSFTMYKIHEDKVIVTSNDSLNCKVIELLYKPKAGKVIVNDIESNQVKNKAIKLYIYENPGKDHSIVVQKEESEFSWSYRYDLNKEIYLDNSSEEIKRFRRLVTFKEK
jgi:hypothetical protein